MLYQTDNPHGGDLYSRPVTLDFSANTNPLGTPESVRRAVIDSVAYLNQYPDSYCRELVVAISDFEQVPAEYILCGCGAAELIFSYCTALKPRKALELAPTFSEYSAALQAVDCQVERYELLARNGFALDKLFLKELSEGEWDVVFLCNPNNPTGQTISPELLEEIAATCHERGIRLFLDECFLDLTDGGRDLSLKHLLGRYPELFILKAFTKSYGMAALRLGYCLSSDRELLTAMGRSVQPWNVSLPAQKAGVAALQETEFLTETRRIIREERAWLRQQLERMAIEVYPSRANYLLLFSSLLLGEKLIEKGILVRDCSNYHGLGQGWYRIAVKQHHENEKLIASIREIREEQ